MKELHHARPNLDHLSKNTFLNMDSHSGVCQSRSDSGNPNWTKASQWLKLPKQLENPKNVPVKPERTPFQHSSKCSSQTEVTQKQSTECQAKRVMSTLDLKIEDTVKPETSKRYSTRQGIDHEKWKRKPTDSDIGDSREDETHKFDTSKLPWEIEEVVSPAKLRPELRQTHDLLKLYMEDIKAVKASLTVSPRRPEFPESEWDNVIKG
jgi:hypothetical protein